MRKEIAAIYGSSLPILCALYTSPIRPFATVYPFYRLGHGGSQRGRDLMKVGVLHRMEQAGYTLYMDGIGPGDCGGLQATQCAINKLRTQGVSSMAWVKSKA